MVTKQYEHDSSSDETQIQEIKSLPIYYNKIKLFFFFSIISYFALNVLASPTLKPLFAFITLQMFFIVILLPWNYSCLFLFIFLLIEPQGRILWGYHPFFRLAFDLLTLICILRVFIKNKKIIDIDIIPKFTLIFLILHFFWFIIELFNPLAAGILASSITLKYYIFPFALYFCSLMLPIDFEEKEIRVIIKFLIFILFLSAALPIFQISQDQQYFFKISPNFLGLFDKMLRFQGVHYRPWGTSNSPGGYSFYLYYLVGFLFLFKPKVKIKLFQSYLTLIIILSIFACFASSIRSALIQYIGIIIAVTALHFVCSTRRVVYTWKLALGIGASIIGIIVIFIIFPNIEKQLNLVTATARIIELTEKGGISKQRGSLGQVTDTLIKNTEIPFGYGLGMCTSYSPQFSKQREFLSGHIKRDYWHYDNFYLFSFLELGLGAIFYLGAIASIPIVLLSMSVTMYRQEKRKEMYITAFSMLMTSFMMIGNWGVISIPFNPASYVFWFWAAQGCHNYYKYFPKNNKREST